MWQTVRVKGIQAPLFWILAFYSIGLFVHQAFEILVVLGFICAFFWIILPEYRADVFLSFVCVALGWMRMDYQTKGFPKCEEPFTNQWICECPSQLKNPCACQPLSSTKPWLVEIKNREFSGRTDRFWGRLDPFRTAGEFDFRQWKYSQGILGKLTLLEIPAVESTTPHVTVISQWRNAIRSLLQLNFDSDAESFLIAVFLGDKKGLSQKVKQAFSNGGIAHVLAVSGYHIGLVGLVPFLLLKNRRKWLRRLGTLLFPLVWVYVALCNAPISAVRAAAMSSFYVAGTCLRRPISSFQCWTLAGIIVLIWKPHAAMALGTQLSFAAVAAILLLLKTAKAMGINRFYLLPLLVPIAAQMGTLAWTANAFGTFPLASLPMNIIVSSGMSALGICVLIWILTRELEILASLAHAIENAISIAIRESFNLLVTCDEKLQWAPSIASWSPLIWLYFTFAFFAWNITLLAYPNQRLKWSMRYFAVTMSLLPWGSPWNPKQDGMQTVRSNSAILIGNRRNLSWIVAENNTALQRALKSNSTSKISFSKVTILGKEELFICNSGWIFRDGQGDWMGRIQNRPFSWNRTGDKNGADTIGFGDLKRNWSPWSPQIHFNLSAEGSSTPDQHNPATRANPK